MASKLPYSPRTSLHQNRMDHWKRLLNRWSCDWCRSRDLIWGELSTFSTDAGFAGFVLESQWLVI
jgi:hypothetical protein